MDVSRIHQRAGCGFPKLSSPIVSAILFAAAITLTFGHAALASGGTRLSPKNESGDYTVGPRDVLDINVTDSPEITGKYRVSNDGYIALPLLPAPINAQGQTAQQLSGTIARALVVAGLLQRPSVTVFVEQFRNQTVTILGAVQRPSVYTLEKPTTLLEALSMAGGLLPSAGNRLTITRSAGDNGESNGSAGAAAPPTQTVDLGNLMDGKDPALNFFVGGGDVLTVSTAPIIYVVGAVRKPGGFAMQNPADGLTVLQALGIAAGLAKDAAPSRSIIIRRNPTTQGRQQIPLNVARLLAGKTADVPLQGDDILFIPDSSMKKSARVLGQTAQEAITGIAIYGLGLRIGRY